MFSVIVISSLLMLYGLITRVSMLHQLLFVLYHIMQTVRIVTCNCKQVQQIFGEVLV